MTVGVFISYNRCDQRIASELRSCLVALSDSLRVFIDHASIGPGEDYDRRISDSINESMWFIMVNPGSPSHEKDMGWCIYEAGQFRNRLASQAMSDKAIVERMCVVYDVRIPSQLRRYQAIRVHNRTPDDEMLDFSADSIRIEKTPVFRLFTTILERSEATPIRPTSDPAIRALIRDQARRFVFAFLTEQVDARLAEVPLQPRISLILPPPPAGGLTMIDPATEVMGWEKALSEVFGIAGETTTWGAIEKAFKLSSGADALWLQDVEAALVSIAADRVPVQTNMLVHAKNGSLYRPVVTRYFPFVSRRREVFVSLIRTPRRSLVPRDRRSSTSTIVPKQHVLLIALLFAFRFKQQVLPLAEAAKGASGDRGRLEPLLMRIEREIMILENEAEEYGFDLSEEHLERPQITDSISDQTDQEIVNRITIDWARVRGQLMQWLSDMRNPRSGTSATDVPCAVIDGLISMTEPNKQFTEIVIRELAKSQDLDICMRDVPGRTPMLAGTRSLSTV